MTHLPDHLPVKQELKAVKAEIEAFKRVSSQVLGIFVAKKRCFGLHPHPGCQSQMKVWVGIPIPYSKWNDPAADWHPGWGGSAKDDNGTPEWLFFFVVDL